MSIMSSEGTQVSTEFESYMRMRFAALEKIYNHITGFEVIMKKTGESQSNYIVEGRVLLSKSSFFCRERAETFEKALEQMIDNLTRQLKRQNEQRTEIW
jgi:ribosomal subunit interface protein